MARRLTPRPSVAAWLEITAAAELVVEAGEALFLPAGWWHQVDALSPSISVTVLEFAWPNDYGWYKPGSWLRGTVEHAR